MSGWRCEKVSFDRRVEAADLVLKPGRVCALVGPSGSGKSTLQWLFAGLLEPTEGRVAPCPGRLGMVFQEPSLWDHLKVIQHLGLLTPDRAQVDELLGRMRLKHLQHRRPPQLSGGEKQRLAFARALSVRPDWLLLDEPTAHLDGASRDEMLELLRDTLAETDAGVLIATHEADVALSCADDIAVMIDGRIVQVGPAAEVYTRPVSLEAARLLGPASMIRGTAEQGGFYLSGRRIIDGIPPCDATDKNLIVRPDWLRLSPESEGPAEVIRSLYQGSHVLLEVRAGHDTLRVQYPSALAPGARGTLTWCGP
ncbi:MAG: ABC transporter ATP-binding protein [Planctomycetota bacterium]